jgi:heme/copper-type cytochrome/quinol oxidase subunit 1
MVMVFIFMKEYGYSLEGFKSAKLVSWQPLLFGVGQTIFVIGFAYAGMHGMGRKLFGSDQSIHSLEAMTGLGLMSIGGLLAMAGGLLFIYIVIKSYINSKKE